MSDDHRPRRRASFSENDLPANGEESPSRRRASFGEDDIAPPPGRRPAPPPGRRPAAPPGAGGSLSGGRDGRSSGGGRPPGPPRPPRNSRRRRRRRPGRVIGIVVLAWLVFMIGTPIYAWSETTKEPVFTAEERPEKQPGTTYLLAGSDSREGLSDAERERLGTGGTEGKRADTIIMYHVPRSGPPVLISLPRDSYVPIPGHGDNKLNAAYAIGGSELLVETVEQVTGVRIDHYVEVGFGGFVNVIDAVGGVEICPETDLQDKNSRLDVQAGCQNADGPTALAYARMRYADPTGDVGRMARQREILNGVAHKVISPVTLLNPFRWWGVNVGLAQALTVDEDTGIPGLLRTAPSIAKIGSGKGLTLVVPIADPNVSTDAGSAMQWDSDAALEMFDQISTGDTKGMERFQQPS